jgi:hypothetical protein
MRGFAVDDPAMIRESPATGRQRTLEQSSDEEKADYGVIKENANPQRPQALHPEEPPTPAAAIYIPLIMPVILEI